MGTRRIESHIGAFRAITLLNDVISVTVVPELGAKIISLQNLHSGREWCWHPSQHLTLHSNHYADSFCESPHVGIDECFPTIEACSYHDRSYPCHGEVWTEAWTLREGDTSCIDLQILPRQFPATLRRRMSLDSNVLRLSYALKSHSTRDEHYVWAFHPFLRLAEGDTLTIPHDVSHLHVGASAGIPGDPTLVNWTAPLPGLDLSRFSLGANEAARIKAFTPALTEGRCSILNERSHDALEISWDHEQNPYLGIWITRGGYRGIQGVAALEPTNAPHDALVEAPTDKYTRLPRGQTREWEIHLRLS